MARTHIKNVALERSQFLSRALFCFAVITVLLLVLVGRYWNLQIAQHETFQTRADDNRIQVQPLAPIRGIIFDRNGIPLADNKAVYTLAIVPEMVPDREALLTELAALVDVTAADIEGFEKRLKRRRRPYSDVALKLALTEQANAVLAVNRHRLPGVTVTRQMVRHYPFGALFAHSVGSVRRINQEDQAKLDPVRYSGSTFMGKRGVEKFYEETLHGEVGYQRVETNAHGRITQVLDVQPAKPGQNITLQLDSRLQIAASAALGDRRGAIVALDTRSGGVLAMVSNPGYDPNPFVTGISQEDYRKLADSRDTPLFNRAVNGQYAPGSTFKPIVGLAGISHGAVTWDETIEDRGWFKLPDQKRIFRDWSWTRENAGGQGKVDLRRAIYRSSNVFFYDLATRMEVDDIARFADQFGIGSRTALDIADASSGLLPNRVWKKGAKGESWYPGDSVNFGIGQGSLLVTPLQLATVSNLIANRGQWVRPRMLLASDAPVTGTTPKEPMPPVIGPKPDDWERMVDAMEDVVHRGRKGYRQNGTAWSHIGRDVAYRMAGKSGTAQVVEILQGEEYDAELLSEYRRKHAWFMAFAPADKPTIAVAVLVENGGGGSSVAAPVAREVLDSYLLPQIAQR